MGELRPIRVALVEFDTTEAQKISTLFAYAERWQQPWRVVSANESPQVVILGADTAEELAVWQRYRREWPPERLVAYAATKPEDAVWYLKRDGNNDGVSSSRVEFTTLLCRLAACLELEDIDGPPETVALADKPENPLPEAVVADLLPQEASSGEELPRGKGAISEPRGILKLLTAFLFGGKD